jgi:hypothetical protein
MPTVGPLISTITHAAVYTSVGCGIIFGSCQHWMRNRTAIAASTPAGPYSAGLVVIGIQDGMGTMRMAHPSFITGRPMGLRPILTLTLGRHPGSVDSPIPASALFPHNFAPVPAGAARANSAGKTLLRYCTVPASLR